MPAVVLPERSSSWAVTRQVSLAPLPTRIPVRIAGDRVVGDGGRRARGDMNAGRTIIRNRIAGAGRGPADRRTGPIDTNAVAIRHGGGAGRIRADLVALDQARRMDVNPVLVLPEMTLPAPVVVPPIVAPEALTKMPTNPFATAAVPAAFVPISLPSIRQAR